MKIAAETYILPLLSATLEGSVSWDPSGLIIVLGAVEDCWSRMFFAIFHEFFGDPSRSSSPLHFSLLSWQIIYFSCLAVAFSFMRRSGGAWCWSLRGCSGVVDPFWSIEVSWSLSQINSLLLCDRGGPFLLLNQIVLYGAHLSAV